MTKRIHLVLCGHLVLAWVVGATPPDDFPHFQVPGHEQEMTAVRDLFWLHYPAAGPKSTLWDEWLSLASLWPAVGSQGLSDQMRRGWRQTLSGRIVDAEGYVATHQHGSIAHQLGWPFPFWAQGQRGFGWHFSFKGTPGPPWRPEHLNRPDGWTVTGSTNAEVNDDGWRVSIAESNALVTAPARNGNTFESPFLQLRWQVEGLGDFQPYVEWTTPTATNFDARRRMYFDSPTDQRMTYTMIPLYRHPQWTGDVSQVRIGLGNPAPGAVTLQALFSQYDTRHNINSQAFIRGAANYFWWTRDLGFLRTNANRMRLALRHLMTEHHGLERRAIHTTWPGHDGRTGLTKTADGKKALRAGHGIGNNYWDLLPFGALDCYASIQYYDTLLTMARLEEEIRTHPEWQIPRGVLSLQPAELRRHAAEVKAEGNRLFWNPETQRFVACIDADGQAHDYGFTFVNLEAIHYGFASAENARAILDWISGGRLVAGDTSQGADIYHWRFGPRATTRRNIEWYGWFWSAPESIPWGGQVQDGGAVLGFSYHDLMARLKVRGPDDAWQRLQEILRWFEEVQTAGGYRKYYDGSREGTLQGGGPPGGLGLDREFFESVLVPQVMLYGFLGFTPQADGFALNPRLPGPWPELSVDRIRFQNCEVRIRARPDAVEVWKTGVRDEPLRLRVAAPIRRAQLLRADGSILRELSAVEWQDDDQDGLDWATADGVRVEFDPRPPRASR